MNTRLLLLCSIVSAGMAADLPYVGKWKPNLAKSDFGQTFMTLESLPGGEWQSTAFGITYKFKMDGKDYSDSLGGAVAWKAIDASTWEMVAKANGKVTETDTFKLGADGKTLTDNAKQMKAGGGSIESTTVYERVSGGPALAGKWKTKKVSGASGILEMTASGSGGLIFKDLDMGMSCDAKLDGKDYPCQGPLMPPGFTVAMQSAARSLDVTVKKDGKPFFKATYTVSADGKSMTETGSTASGSDQFKIVLDRI
ncbi:MAG: hypothetical protein C5B51_04060 [Terriglobia bacterium]|nr:MAG: hypothetical protein C5B51_04060 [Terriglobia bacterium]